MCCYAKHLKSLKQILNFPLRYDWNNIDINFEEDLVTVSACFLSRRCAQSPLAGLKQVESTTFLASLRSFPLDSFIEAPVIQVQPFLAIFNWMNNHVLFQKKEGRWTPFLSLSSSDVMKGWRSDYSQPLRLPFSCWQTWHCSSATTKKVWSSNFTFYSAVFR